MLRLSLQIAAAFLAVFIILPQDTASNPQGKAAQAHVKINTIPARPEDVSTIDGIVKAYYDVVSGPAGRPRQWDRDHTLYIPEVRFIQFSESKDGKISAKSMTHQQFADTTDAALGDHAFYEHEIHRLTHRFGNVAHVLSTAEQSTAPNGPAIGHSIDSLELFYDGHRWWISNANIWPADIPTRPLTPEFLPAAH